MINVEDSLYCLTSSGETVPLESAVMGYPCINNRDALPNLILVDEMLYEVN